jgi:hypothetical protein
VLACRKLFAEVRIEQPTLKLPASLARAESELPERSVADLARAIERDVSGPFVVNRALRDVADVRFANQRVVTADDVTEMIRTSAEVHETWAAVRIWLEGDVRPEDAANVVNALARATVSGYVDERAKSQKELLASLKMLQSRETSKLSELKDKLHVLNRRIQSGTLEQSRPAMRSRELLVSKLDEALADLMGQRVLLLAEQSADEEAGLSVVKTTAVSTEETQAAEKAIPPIAETTPGSAFKRRLAKMDRKIEFLKRSIEELHVAPSPLAALEADREELQEEVAVVSARVKSLDDAIWSCAVRLEHTPSVVALHLLADASTSDDP